MGEAGRRTFRQDLKTGALIAIAGGLLLLLYFATRSFLWLGCGVALLAGLTWVLGSRREVEEAPPQPPRESRDENRTIQVRVFPGCFLFVLGGLALWALVDSESALHALPVIAAFVAALYVLVFATLVISLARSLRAAPEVPEGTVAEWTDAPVPLQEKAKKLIGLGFRVETAQVWRADQDESWEIRLCHEQEGVRGSVGAPPGPTDELPWQFPTCFVSDLEPRPACLSTAAPGRARTFDVSHDCFSRLGPEDPDALLEQHLEDLRFLEERGLRRLRLSAQEYVRLCKRRLRRIFGVLRRARFRYAVKIVLGFVRPRPERRPLAARRRQLSSLRARLERQRRAGAFTSSPS